MKFKNILDFSKATIAEALKDRISTLSAALAYYTLFSIAPLLTIIIAIASFVFSERAAKGELFQQLEGSIGTPAAQTIEKMLAESYHSSAPILATIIATVMLIFGAMGIFGQIRESFRVIWKITPSKKNGGILGILKVVKENLVSFLILISVGLLFIIFLLVNTLVAALIQFTPDWFPFTPFLIHLANFFVPLLISTLLFALLYKYLTEKDWYWRHVWLGAFIASLLFNSGKILLNLYITKTAPASQYGAAGSLIVILLWIYFSSHLLFLGAEIIKIVSKKSK